MRWYQSANNLYTSNSEANSYLALSTEPIHDNLVEQLLDYVEVFSVSIVMRLKLTLSKVVNVDSLLVISILP